MSKGDVLVWYGILVAVFALFGAIPFAGMKTASIRKIGFGACAVGILVGVCVVIKGSMLQ
jgi:hypothetical protein